MDKVTNNLIYKLVWLLPLILAFAIPFGLIAIYYLIKRLAKYFK